MPKRREKEEKGTKYFGDGEFRLHFFYKGGGGEKGREPEKGEKGSISAISNVQSLEEEERIFSLSISSSPLGRKAKRKVVKMPILPYFLSLKGEREERERRRTRVVSISLSSSSERGKRHVEPLAYC